MGRKMGRRLGWIASAVAVLVLCPATSARADLLISFAGTVTANPDPFGEPLAPGVSIGDHFAGTATYSYLPQYGSQAVVGGLPVISIAVDGMTYTSPNGPDFAPNAFDNGIRPDWSNPSQHFYIITSDNFDTDADINPIDNHYLGSISVTTAQIATTTAPNQFGNPTSDIEQAITTDINRGFESGTVSYLGHVLPSGSPFFITGNITSIDVVIIADAVVVPEPATWMLGCVGVVIVVGRRAIGHQRKRA